MALNFKLYKTYIPLILKNIILDKIEKEEGLQLHKDRITRFCQKTQRSSYTIQFHIIDLYDELSEVDMGLLVAGLFGLRQAKVVILLQNCIIEAIEEFLKEEEDELGDEMVFGVDALLAKVSAKGLHVIKVSSGMLPYYSRGKELGESISNVALASNMPFNRMALVGFDDLGEFSLRYDNWYRHVYYDELNLVDVEDMDHRTALQICIDDVRPLFEKSSAHVVHDRLEYIDNALKMDIYND